MDLSATDTILLCILLSVWNFVSGYIGRSIILEIAKNIGPGVILFIALYGLITAGLSLGLIQLLRNG